MKAQTNKLARQLSSMPTTHRTDTLRSIAGKAHAINSRVEFIRDEGRRIRVLIEKAPDDVPSKLDWVHQQLSQI